MKASVAMATYNGERYIEEQLESIVNQTILPYEIVISDDGSQDQTIVVIERIIQKYQELPIIFNVLRNEKEHGIVANFENALLNTSGDVVFICDQDDIWFENKIERVLNIMNAWNVNLLVHDAIVLKQVDDKFVVTDHSIMPWNKESFDGTGVKKICKQEHYADAFKQNYMPGMCMCVRKEFIKRILPISRGYLHDNWINWCAIYEDSYIALNEKLSYYRIHKKNVCGIAEFNCKRSIWYKMKTFDEQGKKSIVHQYLWYRDTFGIAENVDMQDTVRAYEFYVNERINILQKSKIKAIILLYKKYLEGSYKVDGKIVFIHDVWYVLRYSIKKRKEFIGKICEYKRRSK